MSSLLVCLADIDAQQLDDVEPAEPGIILPPDAVAVAFDCSGYERTFTVRDERSLFALPPIHTYRDRRLAGFTTSFALALWYAGRAIMWLYFRHWLAAFWLDIRSTARGIGLVGLGLAAGFSLSILWR